MQGGIMPQLHEPTKTRWSGNYMMLERYNSLYTIAQSIAFEDNHVAPVYLKLACTKTF
jgi:hypothetical protein